MIGPVQEKETKAKVKAMKKILSRPLVLSALASILLVHDCGRTSSNAPKKLTAKKTSRAKKRILKRALVAKSLSALGPKIAVINNPSVR